MRYNIHIECYNKKTKRKIKRNTKHHGVQYEGYENGHFLFAGDVSEYYYRRLTKICARYNANLKIQDSFSSRSTSYRQKFFSSNKPVWRDKYFCAYCGRLVPRKKVTIDHLYPVNCVQKSRYMYKKLKRKGYDSINDERNLVAACEQCNKRKGSKTGLWIIKGRLGRHPSLWIIRKFLRTVILIFTIWYLNDIGIISDIHKFIVRTMNHINL